MKAKQYDYAIRYWHGENRRHSIQGCDEDPDLTDPSSEQQSPGGFSVSFPMTKHLTHTVRHEGWIQTRKGDHCFDWACAHSACLTCRNGTMPSRAMACNRRGAPVRLCSPAPQQEKKEPITITQGEGHDSVPITRFPFTESPNLKSKDTVHEVDSIYLDIWNVGMLT